MTDTPASCPTGSKASFRWASRPSSLSTTSGV